MQAYRIWLLTVFFSSPIKAIKMDNNIPDRIKDKPADIPKRMKIDSESDSTDSDSSESSDSESSSSDSSREKRKERRRERKQRKEWKNRKKQANE